MMNSTKNIIYYLFISAFAIAGNSELFLQRITTVKIDGYLSENSWKNATKISKFYSFLPEEDKPVIEKTAILMGYDPDNFYIAFICFYKDPTNIRKSITMRDDIFDDDYIGFYLDTFDDGKNAYIFVFNPYGIQADGIITEHFDEDYTPDFLIESKGRTFSNGYIIEARIPFSSLNFPDDNEMNWRFAAVRKIQYISHDIVWPKLTVNSTDWIGQFGKLKGIKSINKGKGIEILPEFSAFRTDKLSDTENRIKEGPIKGNAGLNLKFGISSGLNLDLTYNPDFSQVEADANKIDINRLNPLYYDEKRTFFLEGTEIFKTPIEAFYSRQIVDPLAGIKLSGRAGEYSIGLISAIDEYQGSVEYFKSVAKEKKLFNWMPEYSALVDTLKGQYSNKKSINNILRIKRNIFDKSSIGLIITDREFEDSYNRVYGLDGRFTFGENSVIKLQGLYAQTREINSFEKYESPAFYGDYWYGTNTWNLQLFYNDYSSTFRLQNGFISRTDLLQNGYRDVGASLYYEFRHQDRSIQHFRPYIYVSQAYNHQNNLIEQYIYSSLFFRFDFQTDLTIANYIFKEKYTLFDSYTDMQFDKNNFVFDIANTSLAWFTPSVYYYFGDEIFYYAPLVGVEPFLGKVKRGNIKFIFKPVSKLSTDFAYHFYRFDGKHSDLNGIEYNFASTQQILRAKINYQLSRYFAIRLIIQDDRTDYDDPYFNFWEYGNVDLNFLLSYVPSPGTVIFLGYNDLRSKTDGYNDGIILKNYRLQQRGLFLKLSYLFKTAL